MSTIAYTLCTIIIGFSVIAHIKTTCWYFDHRYTIDILLYGDAIVDDEQLIIPHPQMHTRLFVLEPFVEIAPNVVKKNKKNVTKIKKYQFSELVSELNSEQYETLICHNDELCLGSEVTNDVTMACHCLNDEANRVIKSSKQQQQYSYSKQFRQGKTLLGVLVL